jgi:hypothetical protein
LGCAGNVGAGFRGAGLVGAGFVGAGFAGTGLAGAGFPGTGLTGTLPAESVAARVVSPGGFKESPGIASESRGGGSGTTNVPTTFPLTPVTFRTPRISTT